MPDLIHCPNCGSNNCQSFVVAHSHGTVQARVTHRSLGLGIPQSQSTVVQQSAIGAITSPPTRKRTILQTLVLLYFSFTTIVGLGLIVSGQSPAAGIIVAAICGSLGYLTFKWRQRVARWNSTVFPSLYYEWRRSFLCNKCGMTFCVPAPSEVAATTEQK